MKSVKFALGYQNLANDIELMLGKKPNIFFKYNWLIISPILLTVSNSCIFSFPILKMIKISSALSCNKNKSFYPGHRGV